MSIVADFLNSVADPFRGSNTAPNTPVAHGGGYISPNPAVAGWLDQYPEIAGRLGRTQNTVSALDGRHEGALTAFNKARERYDESKAAEARAQFAAREVGQAVDAELAKRLLTARKEAMAANEAAASRSHIASQDFASTRDVLNEAVKFIGKLAANRQSIKLAPAVKLPSGTVTDIVAAQRRTIVGIKAELDAIESAPIPLEDAIAQVRASVVSKPPELEIGPRRVDWVPPKQMLNVAPRLGDGTVDIVDTTALLGWLFGDLIADKLEAQLRATYGNVRTYTPVERRKAITSVQTRLREAEALEVAAVFKAWGDAQYIPLRRDTSPMALLGIESIGEPAKDPAGFKGTHFLGEGQR